MFAIHLHMHTFTYASFTTLRSIKCIIFMHLFFCNDVPICIVCPFITTVLKSRIKWSNSTDSLIYCSLQTRHSPIRHLSLHAIVSNIANFVFNWAVLWHVRRPRDNGPLRVPLSPSNSLIHVISVV